MNKLRLTLITGAIGDEKEADIGLRLISGDELSEPFIKDLGVAIVTKGVRIEVAPGMLTMYIGESQGVRFLVDDEGSRRIQNFLSFQGEKKISWQRALLWKFLVSIGDTEGKDSLDLRGELLQPGSGAHYLAQAS